MAVNGPRVVGLAMWRNDQHRDLERRMSILLSKSYPGLRWVWVVGDSEDYTEQHLRSLVALWQMQDRVTIVHHDTGMVGDDPATRMLRLSATANVYLAQVRAEDDLCLLHESDIDSPVDVVERLLATGKCPVAGWPLLRLGSEWVFYDVAVYRKDGVLFSNRPPYHACYRPGELFEVDAAGTCLLFPAACVRAGARCIDAGVLDLCNWMKDHGYSLWVDPTLVVHQPTELWTPQAPADSLRAGVRP